MSNHLCLTCQARPKAKDNPLLCRVCARRIHAAEAERQPKTHDVRLYVHWRGFVVGFYPSDAKRETCQARPVFKDLTTLPRGKTVNLDVFCSEWDKNQVKAFKRTILRQHGLAEAPPLLRPQEAPKVNRRRRTVAA